MLICTQNQLQVFTKSQISTNFLWHRLPEKCSRLQSHWHSCLMRFIDFNILVDADADISKIKGVNLILCMMGVKNLFFAHLCFLPPKVSKLFWAEGPPIWGMPKIKGAFYWKASLTWRRPASAGTFWSRVADSVGVQRGGATVIGESGFCSIVILFSLLLFLTWLCWKHWEVCSLFHLISNQCCCRSPLLGQPGWAS